MAVITRFVRVDDRVSAGLELTHGRAAIPGIRVCVVAGLRGALVPVAAHVLRAVRLAGLSGAVAVEVVALFLSGPRVPYEAVPAGREGAGVGAGAAVGVVVGAPPA